jgi:integrase/recombinase XerD
MLLLAAPTGLRASELIGLRCTDVQLGVGAHVNCLGKRRKQRITPLARQTVSVLRAWLAERTGHPHDRCPIAQRPPAQPRRARAPPRQTPPHRRPGLPSLATKKITLHVLRHTAAMRLLHAGFDTSAIHYASATNSSTRPGFSLYAGAAKTSRPAA